MSASSDYILSLDQGTTSSRAILFNHAGEACYTAQKEYPQYFPHPGWVEQEAEEIWTSQEEVMYAVMQEAGILLADAPDVIKSLGITNQRETVIVWERATGLPIYKAISWQDRRTGDYCAELKGQGSEEMVRRKTGLRLDPYFSGTKLKWILDNVEGARERAEKGELCFGTVDAWLLWKLTEGEVWATDYSNASRTLLFNIHTQSWDEELLELFQIPVEILPKVRETSDDYGQTREGVLIRAVAGDQQSALFGQACFTSGMAKNTYGTGCFLLMQTEGKAVMSKHNLLTTIAWKVNGEVSYALEGAVFTAGSAIKWLRDGLGIIQEASECEKLALEVSDNGGLTFIPAFSGLGAPYWSDSVRGAFLGMTGGVNKRHICRATLEAIALQSYELVACMEADAGILLKELRVDGGATQSMLLMELQANLLQVPVVKPSEQEVTALGAAYLAGLKVGYWSSLEEISASWRVKSTLTSELPRDEALMTQWKTAVDSMMPCA